MSTRRFELVNQKGLAAVFFSLAVSLSLHIVQMPWWVFVMAGFVMVWRYCIYSGRLPKAHWSLRGVLVIVGLSAVYTQYGFAPSIESTTVLLISGMILKPLETYSTRDAYLLLFLSYLLMGMAFLFDQTPVMFAWVIVALVINLSAQIRMHQGFEVRYVESLKLASKLFLKALPLAVFLFFVMPRLGPLWTLNIPTQAGVVGLSETMTPGQFSSLGQNDELAFRVEFDGAVPPMSERYWRAMVLDFFDGETWRQQYQADRASSSGLVLNPQAPYRYQITVEAHEKKWLFALANSESESEEVRQYDDGTFRNRRNLYSKRQYQMVSSAGEWISQSELSLTERRAFLQQPSLNNQQTRELAQSIQNSTDSTFSAIDAVKQRFNQQNYRYTLNPPVLNGESTIDQFLFESQAGFCAHYAGAFVFIMREMDIPARVVVGYHGGEENQSGNYYAVYQYDAHAWAEVYIEKRGWIRVDPTSWISPDRIEQGLGQAVQDEFVGFQSNYEWLRKLRQQLAAFDYFWNDWMLSYKGDKQKEWLSQLWGDHGNWQTLLMTVVTFLFILVLPLAFIWWSQRPAPDSYEKKLFKQFCKTLLNEADQAKVGLTWHQVTLQAKQKHPSLNDKIAIFERLITQKLYQYADGYLNKQDYLQCRAVIKSMRKK